MKFHAFVFSAALAASSLGAQTKPSTAKPATAKPAARKPATTGTKPTTPSTSKPASSTPASAATATPPAASGSGKVVMQVGDESITAAEFDNLIEALPEQVRAQARGPMKRQMAEQVVRVKLLAQEAKKKGLDKDKGIQTRIQFQTENLLAGAAYNAINEGTTIDEAAARKYYDEHKGEYERIAARHILIKFKGSPVPAREGKTEELSEEAALAKAEDLRKKILAGGDFSAFAKAESDDTGSGQNGGQLGTFGHGQMVPEFEKTAFSLPVGQVSQPVKTQFGYHLILVDKQENKAFEEVRTEIEGKLKPQAAGAAVEALRKSSVVKLDDDYFGPVGPPPGAPPAGAAVPPPAPAPAK